MTDPVTLVVGGTGTTGSRVVRRLEGQGVKVRIASRHRATGIDGRREHVRFDWAGDSTHGPALQGVDRAYLVAPVYVADPTPMMLPFIDRARGEGVARIVLLSASVIPAGSPGLGQVHAALSAGRSGWAVLQPSWFMQNTLGAHHHAVSIAREGVIATATADGRVPLVDADDIAEVAVRALTDAEPHDAAHVLTGPQALTYDEVTEQLSAVAGHPIRHEKVSADTARRRMGNAGVPETFAAILAQLEEAIAAGAEDRVTPTVERVTGHPPRAFADFAAANGGAWRRDPSSDSTSSATEEE